MLFFGRNKARAWCLTPQIRLRRKAFVMLQLFELIASSPLGAFFVSALRDTYYAAMILADCEECGFNDLGKLLFGGVILAFWPSRGLAVLATTKGKTARVRIRFDSIERQQEMNPFRGGYCPPVLDCGDGRAVARSKQLTQG